MVPKVNRVTVELSEHPDLVVIYLGMRAKSLRGIGTLLGFGPRISSAVAAKPDGLLLHENLIFSLFPLHLGMRQYWRDFESLEAWARKLPHQQWWQDFVRDPKGTAFWHETYFLRGGMEAIYDNVSKPIGLMQFAPQQQARGAMFSARKRAGITGEPSSAAPIEEDQPS